jgi:hypothetical protein
MFEPLPTAKAPTPPPPCRLYVILARDAPVGVIFRRGPAKRVQIVHWDTETDTFTPGQWFHGRIYERRSDISPNGKLLIYSARKSEARTINADIGDYWTAVSKPPYLTALALWPCFSAVGGGLFFSDTKVWLNHYRTPEAHPNHLPKNLWVYNSGNDVSEHTFFDRRLTRDGWETIQEGRGKPTEYSRSATLVPGICRKRNPHGLQDLTMTTTVSNFTSQDRFSVGYAEGEELPLEGAEWADWDQQGRLVFARNGKIFALAADAIGQEPPEELIDLNRNRPKHVVAPDWAKTW